MRWDAEVGSGSGGGSGGMISDKGGVWSGGRGRVWVEDGVWMESYVSEEGRRKKV